MDDVPHHRKLREERANEPTEPVNPSRSRDLNFSFTEAMLVVMPVLAILAAVMWALFQFVQPAPPRVTTIATGSTSGAYFGFARRYADILRRSGIRLIVRPTAGSIENLKLLTAPDRGVDIALLQGGITNKKLSPDIVSLGRLFPEPLWVFYRGDQKIDSLNQLRGKRLAIGPVGSGTRHLAMALLGANNIDAHAATLLPISGKEAALALGKGEVDAIFLAMAPQSPVVKRLVEEPGIHLMSFAQANAYVRLHPYLERITLPRGAIDLARDLPREAVTMVAPVAVLAVRKGLHPALQGLLIDAARQVHGGAGLFYSAHTFPRASDPELDMASDAERYYRAGPSFLKRYLPFWLATFIERMVVIALPVVGLLIPAFKGLPYLYRWRILRRLNYWYGELKALERQLAVTTDRREAERLRSQLNHIEQTVAEMHVPLAFSQDYYELRSAIDLVRKRLAERIGLMIPNLT
ncbi:MAG: TAXI family TRAP transporter solute-binding subunit [Hyphomicrobiaceae bacterium]